MARCRVYFLVLTHWGRVAHICVSKLIIIGSDNGWAPGRSQAIIWTSAVILSIQNSEINLQRNLRGNWNIFIQENIFENVVSKMVVVLFRPQCAKILSTMYLCNRVLSEMSCYNLTHCNEDMLQLQSTSTGFFHGYHFGSQACKLEYL